MSLLKIFKKHVCVVEEDDDEEYRIKDIAYTKIFMTKEVSRRKQAEELRLLYNVPVTKEGDVL